MTRTLPGHLAHLPVHRGLPVPWVASWTGEHHPGLVEVEFTPTGVAGHRGTVEVYGMTWIDVGMLLQGVGEPDFGATSSGRQRRCMKGRCQVCGRRIEGAPWWIIPRPGGWTRDTISERPALETKQPPVCRPCADTAPLWCPHLAHHPHEVLHATATPVAAVGDVMVPAADFATTTGVIVDLDDPMRVHLLGRELIVRLTPC